MPNSKRNRNSQKGSEEENHRGAEQPGYTKLRDNPRNLPTDNASTAGDTSDEKYSRTNLRKEEKRRRSDQV